jgi:hypothetical protein
MSFGTGNRKNGLSKRSNSLKSLECTCQKSLIHVGAHFIREQMEVPIELRLCENDRPRSLIGFLSRAPG